MKSRIVRIVMMITLGAFLTVAFLSGPFANYGQAQVGLDHLKAARSYSISQHILDRHGEPDDLTTQAAHRLVS